jgi:hypothetical protein
MISLAGQCFGLVRNTLPNIADDANCHWKSGNENFQKASQSYSQVNKN